MVNDFRKTLEAFVELIHFSAQDESQPFYKKLHKVVEALKTRQDSYLHEGDIGYINALLKVVQTVGNYGSHHQVSSDKDIDERHIDLCRNALHILISLCLAEDIDQKFDDFLRPHKLDLSPDRDFIKNI